MFCQNCGAKVKDDAVFCSSCGKRIGANLEVTLQAADPVINTVENKADGITGDAIQETKDLSNIIGTQYSLTWKSYSLTRFPISIFLYENMTKTLELKEDKIDVIGPEPWLGKQTLLKSINYKEIASVSCDVKPANTAVGWIIPILFILFIWLIGNIVDIDTAFALVLGILEIYIIPIWSRSSIKPVYLTIVEKNGKKTKLKGEKAYAQVAVEAEKNIKTLMSK